MRATGLNLNVAGSFFYLSCNNFLLGHRLKDKQK